MFAPTKTWRRWHRKVNVNQRRYAMCSAIAASGIPALIMSKGHKIEQTPEIPLVVSDNIESYDKTKQAVLLLKRLKGWPDIDKVYQSKRFRAGKGKMRNRRRIQRKGPLVVYNKDKGLKKAFRNIPGVDLVKVTCLNLMKLAPGGHVGRFVIWTESAFKKLDKLYGTWRKPSKMKTGYNLPMPKMTNSDLSRLLKSDEIKKVIGKPRRKIQRHVLKKNPLKNIRTMLRLNPYMAVQKRAAILNVERQKRKREVAFAKKRGLEVPKNVEREKRFAQRNAAYAKSKKVVKGGAVVIKPPASGKNAVLRGKRLAKDRLKKKAEIMAAKRVSLMAKLKIAKNPDKVLKQLEEKPQTKKILLKRLGRVNQQKKKKVIEKEEKTKAAKKEEAVKKRKPKKRVVSEKAAEQKKLALAKKARRLEDKQRKAASIKKGKPFKKQVKKEEAKAPAAEVAAK